MKFCLACGKKLKKGRRGLWHYYCNKKCYKQAIQDFKEGIKELVKNKNTIICVIESNKD